MTKPPARTIRDQIDSLEVSRAFMTRKALAITGLPLGGIIALTLTTHTRTTVAIGCAAMFAATVLWLVFIGRVRERATVQIERLHAELRRVEP